MSGQVDVPEAAIAKASIDIVHEKKNTDGLSPLDKDQGYDLDGIHDGLEFPTAEELVNLRHVSDRIPWDAYRKSVRILIRSLKPCTVIAVIEAAERFSYYGSQVVFTNFIQRSLPSGSTTGAGGNDTQSGALGLGQRASTGIGTFFQFWYVYSAAGNVTDNPA